jgi:hypothetical protein
MLQIYLGSQAQYGIGVGYTSATFLQKVGKMQDGINFNISRKNKRQTLVFGVSHYPEISYFKGNMPLYDLGTYNMTTTTASVTARRTITDIYGEVFIDYYKPDESVCLYVLAGVGVVVRKVEYEVGPFDNSKYFVDEYRLYDFSDFNAPLVNLSFNAGAGVRHDIGKLSLFAEVKTTPLLNIAVDEFYPMLLCVRMGGILNIRQKKLFE